MLRDQLLLPDFEPAIPFLVLLLSFCLMPFHFLREIKGVLFSRKLSLHTPKARVSVHGNPCIVYFNMAFHQF